MRQVDKEKERQKERQLEMEKQLELEKILQNTEKMKLELEPSKLQLIRENKLSLGGLVGVCFCWFCTSLC